MSVMLMTLPNSVSFQGYHLLRLAKQANTMHTTGKHKACDATLANYAGLTVLLPDHLCFFTL